MLRVVRGLPVQEGSADVKHLLLSAHFSLPLGIKTVHRALENSLTC